MSKMFIELTHEEIKEKIPYAAICEARFGSRWNTGRRKRMWTDSFSESERKESSRLFAEAKRWYLVSGAPKMIRMTLETYNLWQKLYQFCLALWEE